MNNTIKYVLWGSAGHAKVLSDLICFRGGKVIALFDNNKVPSALDGVPVYYGEDEFRKWIKNENTTEKLFGSVAIGGGGGCDRLFIHNLFRENGVELTYLIHPTAVVSLSAKIGIGSQILANSVVGADAIIGEAGIVNHNAVVDHECVLGDGVHIAPSATLCGCVSVGDNVFIGAGATILPRINIGADSVIGAGSVVTKDVYRGEVVVGNPARLIKSIK